ncbi:MAG: metal-dependent hydrolase, partial [Halobacteriales archaeon]
LVALPFAALHPEFAPWLVAAGVSGGLLPDVDVVRGHRRLLHYPVALPPVALAVVALALASGDVVVSVVGVAVSASALHSLMDVCGGGLGLRPWRSGERAVYDHVRGRWLSPRRGVRYDGAPEDLALSFALAVPAVYYFDFARLFVFGALAVSAAYAVLRKPLADEVESLLDIVDTGGWTPAWVRE